MTIPAHAALIAGYAATAAGLTISFVETITGTTALDFTNAVASDLLVYIDYADNSPSSVSSVTPSGFTLHTAATGSSTGRKCNVSYKIATGSEGSINGMTGGVTNTKVGFIFRGSSAIAAIAEGTQADSGFTSSDPADQALNSDADTPPLVVFGVFASTGTVSPATMTPSEDGSGGSGNLIAKYKIYNSSPADVTVAMDDEGAANYLCGFVLELS